MGRLCDDASGSMAAFKVKAVDTTGAGDAFCAGLLHALGRWSHYAYESCF
jgi:sugar/nucleoside kinase (ribokinase family)